jgi:hypothetical protein
LQFSRERPFTYSGGVSFADTHNFIYGVGADAAAAGGVTCRGIGRSDIGICSVINIQLRTLRAFEKYFLPVFVFCVEHK